MAKRDRQLSVFTLSFLDVMAGGFGAIVIIFLIIDHAVEPDPDTENRDLLSEARLLDFQVTSGEEQLTILQETLNDLTIRLADTNETIETVVEELDIKEEDLEELEVEREMKSDTLKSLIKEVDQREREVETMRQNARRTGGRTTVVVAGEGDRQYLTGMFVGGNNIVIALDASASMLDKSIVNVLRRRNMDRERQLNAPKWQRAIRTVEWVTANIPIESKFQIVLYNTKIHFMHEEYQWISASDGGAVRAALSNVATHVPEDGTNLFFLMDAIAQFEPIPDNLFLITDGLPTQGEYPSNRTKVDARQRADLFIDAVNALPVGVPINVILMPLEGDFYAAALYWNLAYRTGGTFMAPSNDWP